MKNRLLATLAVVIMATAGFFLHPAMSQATCANPGLYCNLSQLTPIAITYEITDTAQIATTNPGNDFLNIYNGNLPVFLLILIAMLGLGFGVLLLRRFTRPKGVH